MDFFDLSFSSFRLTRFRFFLIVALDVVVELDAEPVVVQELFNLDVQARGRTPQQQVGRA
jgi:hypothetical protein